MLRTQALCRPSSQQNDNKDEVPARQIRNLNFSPSTKKRTEHSVERFLSKVVIYWLSSGFLEINPGKHDAC